MQTYKTAVFPSRMFDLLLRLSDRSLKKHEPLFMCNRVTVCFFFVLVFGLNSIKLSITDQLSLTMTREDHALLSLSLSVVFQLYTCHLPYVLKYASISFINSRFEEDEHELSSMHHIKNTVYSRAVF